LSLLVISHLFSVLITSLLQVGSYPFLKRIDQSQFFKIHFKKVALLISLFVFLSIATSVIYQEHKVAEIQKKTFQDLDYIAEILKEQNHELIHNENDKASAHYLNIIQLEKKWQEKEQDFYSDIYTIRKNQSNQFILIADAETDYDFDGIYSGEREQRTAIGEVYEKNLPALVQAFDLKQPAFDDIVYTDRWGTFVSGFYPLTTKSGQFDAVVGVDFDAKKLIAQALMSVTLIAFSFLTLYLVVIFYFYNQHSVSVYQNSLESTLGQLGKSLTFQKQFVATVSHELRTPLNGISGALNLIEFEKMLPADRENLQIVRQCTQILTDIVGDVLDLSKIESGQMSLEKNEIPLIDFLTNIRILFTKQMMQKGLKFEIEIEESLKEDLYLADDLRLRQVLINFISNAYKFTSFGHVKLSAGLLHKNSQEAILQFKIKDTGVGFTFEQEKRLFKAFSQADSSVTRKFGGTGLGLVICKNLIEMMGGELYFQSQPGKGTMFVFTIKCGYIKQTRIVPHFVEQKIDHISLNDLKILVADDVLVNQVVLSKTLNKMGYKTELAANGIEVLERHETLGFDLIFMDCQMPLMDGFKATQEIREMEQKNNSKPVFIVAVTGNSTADDQRQCFQSGMNHFLAKPFKTEDIENAIQLAFKNKQQNEAEMKVA